MLHYIKGLMTLIANHSLFQSYVYGSTTFPGLKAADCGDSHAAEISNIKTSKYQEYA
jgi:hypothetical protein